MKTSSMTIDQLNTYIGGLSNPSKMPGYSFSIPAKECKTGGKLQAVPGSVCFECYALEGFYRFKGTVKAMYRRLAAIDEPYWVDAFAEILNRRAKKHEYFRWHDSGDLQSVEHLDKIVRIARLTPSVKHWIPTREYRIVLDWLKIHGKDSIPENLVIRFSAHMVGGVAPTKFNFPMSTVSESEDVYPDAWHCPARFQDNFCGDCRACWNPDVPHVDYHKH